VLPLHDQFGQIDIYLFDQLLRGNIQRGMKIFDAGCGGGRNLVYFLREGYEVFAVDPNPSAIQAVLQLAASLAPRLPEDNFRAEPVESSTFPEKFADVAIVSAVLHFARDQEQFEAMLNGAWRILKSGGLFFCRLASSIGIEQQVAYTSPGRYRLRDGSDRYLVDANTLAGLEGQLGARRVDPLKTTIVENQRAMTTWVLQKPGSP